ncbi:MAG: RNA methyltransferase [Candidatus Obscuribacterales bacterium]|nr:RNA methyltransferase [Candidatus Obscuribacterales bacterium]
MKIKEISSAANDLLKQVRSLHKRQGREKQGLFLVEGQRGIIEACRKNLVLRHVVLSKAAAETFIAELSAFPLSEVNIVEPTLFSSLVTTAGPSTALAVAEVLPERSAQIFAASNPLIVIADAIQDPGNLGTIMRTAHAANAQGIILSKGCVDVYNSKVVRAAAGALFDLPFWADLEAETIISILQEKNIAIATCSPLGQKNYFDYDMRGPLALVLGNEGQGLSPVFAECESEMIAIPMNARAESLNVGISAGIILFEAYKQRLSYATVHK